MQRLGWERVIVVAPGPSLTNDVALTVEVRIDQGWRVIAVQDAWRRVPGAHVLYACDRAWWDYHGKAVNAKFVGERWSGTASSSQTDDDKVAWGRCSEFDIQLVKASPDEGFCLTPGRIHYGNNSGFQAVNLALQFGAKEIRLVGFDMRRVNGEAHFFGEHPEELRADSNYNAFVADFKRAAGMLPADRKVICCTPESALISCFPRGEL